MREPHVLSPSCIMYSFRVPALEIMRLLSSFRVMICVNRRANGRTATHRRTPRLSTGA